MATAAELGAQACPATNGPWGPHELGFRNALAQTFGDRRFTLQDVWRERPGTHAWPYLWERFSGVSRKWPEPAWAEQMRLQLGRLPGIEPAPGSRGGEGWRVAPVVVERLVRKGEEAEAARAARNAPRQAAAAALSSRLAVITLDEAAQRAEAAYPNLELVPRWEWGVLRPTTVGTVIEEWSRVHRYAGVTVYGVPGRVSCAWEHAAKLARVLAQLDEVVARRIEAAARHHKARLAALAPHRTTDTPQPTIPANERTGR